MYSHLNPTRFILNRYTGIETTYVKRNISSAIPFLSFKQGRAVLH